MLRTRSCSGDGSSPPAWRTSASATSDASGIPRTWTFAREVTSTTPLPRPAARAQRAQGVEREPPAREADAGEASVPGRVEAQHAGTPVRHDARRGRRLAHAEAAFCVLGGDAVRHGKRSSSCRLTCARGRCCRFTAVRRSVDRSSGSDTSATAAFPGPRDPVACVPSRVSLPLRVSSGFRPDSLTLVGAIDSQARRYRNSPRVPSTGGSDSSNNRTSVRVLAHERRHLRPAVPRHHPRPRRCATGD